MGAGPHLKDYADVLSRLKARMKVNEETGCWEWQKYKFNGYAKSSCKRFFPETTAAYRIAYLASGLTIPAGMELHHMCMNRGCINPDHLKPITHAENTRLGVYPKETHRNGRKTHCKRGHPFDEKNTLRLPSDPEHRQCRTCINEKGKRAYLKRKGRLECLSY